MKLLVFTNVVMNCVLYKTKHMLVHTYFVFVIQSHKQKYIPNIKELHNLLNSLGLNNLP